MSEFMKILGSQDEERALKTLDEFMDALREAIPDLYAELMHNLRKK